MKKETRIGEKIRRHMYDDYGTILHKNHGGAFGETGAADYYGTLPGGRAIYIELKTPDTIKKKSSRRSYQEAWLRREAALGAFTCVVASYEELHTVLSQEGGLKPLIGF